MFIAVVMLFPEGLAGLDLPRAFRSSKGFFSRLAGKRSAPTGLDVPREVASAPSMTSGGTP